MGRWEVCLYPQRRCFAACSGFLMVGPATRNLWGDGRVAYTHSGAASQLWVRTNFPSYPIVPRRGTYRVRCEMRYDMYEMHCVMCEMHCVMCEMRSVLEGHVYMKPTASCGAAQLWVRTNFPSYPIVPRRGTYGYSSGRKYWSIGNPHCMYIFFSSSLKLNLVWWAF